MRWFIWLVPRVTHPVRRRALHVPFLARVGDFRHWLVLPRIRAQRSLPPRGERRRIPATPRFERPSLLPELEILPAGRIRKGILSGSVDREGLMDLAGALPPVYMVRAEHRALKPMKH